VGSNIGDGPGSCRAALRSAPRPGQERPVSYGMDLLAKSKNDRNINAIPPVQPLPKKFFVSRPTQIKPTTHAIPHPLRGAYASSRTLGAGCGGRGHVEGRTTRRGRRRRVVLMPRRWHQVGDDALHRAGDGDKKARSPERARKNPLKPSRRECRIVAVPVVTMLVCFFNSHARPRVRATHPAFPAPSPSRVTLDKTRARLSRRGNEKTCDCEGRTLRSNPVLSCVSGSLRLRSLRR
jgi:hypothetical protein